MFRSTVTSRIVPPAPLVWLVTSLLAMCACAVPPLRPPLPRLRPTLPPPVRFSLQSWLDAALPAVQPLVEATSSKCETLKSWFGVTYEQMLAKNATDLSVLNIDLITKRGNVKFDFLSTRRLSRVMSKANSTIILIHGFMESSEGYMVQGLAPALLNKPGYKVFALDGRRFINFEYFRASTYARLMGERLGDLLSELINEGQEPSTLTLIGHSLGAHIAGIAGKRLQALTQQSPGRIIGLDPAAPCFANSNPEGQLQKTDASYVDVIHTSAGILGIKEPVGDKDFYPNGGMSQPGCYLSPCDHSRAWQLLAEAILAPDHFPARKCTSWQTFRDGLCSTNEVAYMGMTSEGSSGMYFLSTAPALPYGLGPAGSG